MFIQGIFCYLGRLRPKQFFKNALNSLFRYLGIGQIATHKNLLKLIQNLSVLVAKRDDQINILDVEIPTLPKDFVMISGYQFQQIIERHRSRLSTFFDPADIDKIEKEQRNLFKIYNTKRLIEITIN
eukprot:TRINITY_DN1026_c0_g1_i4.p3 TRINITY_DN1026_c0_g1~~TRINITY_DN1026_c0_g1_i4.p3  ORF type:complete len:127 (-),score=3.01 TRINITY_DN1026_c0_g1_i4:269-649(-)